MWTEIFLLFFGLFGTFVQGHMESFFEVRRLLPKNWQTEHDLNEGDSTTLRITLFNRNYVSNKIDLPYYGCTIALNGTQIIHNIMTSYNKISPSASYDQDEIDETYTTNVVSKRPGSKVSYQCEIRINSIIPDLAGNWSFELTTCNASDFYYNRLDKCSPKDHKKIKQSIKLNVKKLDFTIEDMLESKDVIEGDEVIFNCSVNEPFQQCTIWNIETNCYFNYSNPENSTIKNWDCDHRTKYLHLSGGKSCILILENITTNDSGDWKCKVSRNYGNPTVSKNASLNVAKFVVESFEIEPKPDKGTFEEGDSVNLICKASNSTSFNTCKIKDNSKVIHSVENGTTWCNYTIENVGKEDEVNSSYEVNWSCELVRKSYIATKQTSIKVKKFRAVTTPYVVTLDPINPVLKWAVNMQYKSCSIKKESNDGNCWFGELSEDSRCKKSQRSVKGSKDKGGCWFELFPKYDSSCTDSNNRFNISYSKEEGGGYYCKLSIRDVEEKDEGKWHFIMKRHGGFIVKEKLILSKEEIINDTQNLSAQWIILAIIAAVLLVISILSIALYFKKFKLEDGPRVYSQMMVTSPLDFLYELPTWLVIGTYKIEQLLPYKGVYRVNGNVVEVQLLKQQMDKNDFKPLQNCKNINTIASTIKLYIRELPQALISTELAMKIASIIKNDTTENSKHDEISNLIKWETTTSEKNIKILKFLLKHLNTITQNPNSKMDAKNLAICFSSNIIHNLAEQQQEQRVRRQNSMIREANEFNLVIEWLIKEIEELNLDTTA